MLDADELDRNRFPALRPCQAGHGSGNRRRVLERQSLPRELHLAAGSDDTPVPSCNRPGSAQAVARAVPAAAAAIVWTPVRVWTGSRRRQTRAGNRANTVRTARRRSAALVVGVFRALVPQGQRLQDRLSTERARQRCLDRDLRRVVRRQAAQVDAAPSSGPERRSGNPLNNTFVAFRAWWRSERLPGAQVSAFHDCIARQCRPAAAHGHVTGERKRVCRVKGAAIGRAAGRSVDGIGESFLEHTACHREPCTGSG